MQNFLYSIAILVMTMSCKAPQSATDTFQENQKIVESIDSIKWRLVKIYTDSHTISVSTKAFIRMDKSKGSAGGNGSCNSFGSTMKLEGNAISFTNIFSTKIYCDEVQSIENAFLGHLQKVTRYEIKGKTLSLFNGDRLLLEFEKDSAAKS